MTEQDFRAAKVIIYKPQEQTPYRLGNIIGKGQWVVKEAWKRSETCDRRHASETDDRRHASGTNDRRNASGTNDRRHASGTNDRDAPAPYAQKIIDLDLVDDPCVEESELRATKESVKKEFLREVKVHRNTQHQHVIKFVDAFAYNNVTELAVVMVRMESTLSDHLGTKTNYPQQEWFGCLIAAVDYLHGFGIRHRDIKPDNILVDKEKKVYLADFGISTMGIGITISTSVPAFGRDRTKRFCAPEVEYGSSRGRSADIFSLGAVFLTMIVACISKEREKKVVVPLQGPGERTFAKSLDKVQKFMDDDLQNLEDWQTEIISLCRWMLQEDCHDRPEARDLPEKISSPASICNCTGMTTSDKNTDLVEACKKGSLEKVKRFIEQGADPKTLGAIQQASARGCIEVVQHLIGSVNVNLPDYSNQTALHCAAGYGHTSIIKLLLRQSGIITLSKDVEGRTPLHYAAGAGHKAIVDILIKRDKAKTIVGMLDQNKQTALHFAAKRGHRKVVRRLLRDMRSKQVKDAYMKDKDDRTPLHFAAGYGALGVVKSLLSYGINYDVQDGRGMTALHFATNGKRSQGRYPEVVNALLEAGANPTLTDKNHFTAVHVLDELDRRHQLLSARMDAYRQGHTGRKQETSRTWERSAVNRNSGDVSASFHHDLISLLTLAQYHKVDIWPVSWDDELNELGAGAMGDVRQSLPLLDERSQFAFKRFIHDRKRHQQYSSTGSVTFSSFQSDDMLFRALISEIVILSQPDVRRHSHIVNIEGIAFDVDTSDCDHLQVWPVLVLQKALHGSLRTFLRGRTLDLSSRLKICSQVGAALLTMHSNNIVHGDIKPENILVHNDGEGMCVKVTDFSYSCMGMTENDVVTVPRSEPWTAPEYHPGGFSILEAKSMDIYSFGMVCLWLLFPTALKQLTRPHGPRLGCETEGILEGVKELVRQEDSLDLVRRDRLIQFFEVTLCQDPGRREKNSEELVKLLGQKIWQPVDEERPWDGAGLLALANRRATEEDMIDGKSFEALTARILSSLHLTGEAFDVLRSLLSSAKLESTGRAQEYLDLTLERMSSYGVVSVKKDVQTRTFLMHSCFNVCYAFHQLVRLDYRVRIHIVRCLEKRASGTCRQCASSAAAESAFCYTLGLGVHADRGQAQQWLMKSGASDNVLNRRLHDLKTLPIAAMETANYSKFANKGFFQCSARMRYGDSNLRSTEEHITQELHDLEQILGSHHWQILPLYLQLMDVLCIRGKFNDAMDLSRRLQASFQAKPRVSLSMRVNADVVLANFHLMKNQWEHAECLLLEAKAILLKEVGPGHLRTIQTCRDLAEMYTFWGRIDDAEREFAQLVPVVEQRLHRDHHLKYQVIAQYAAILERQNKVKAADGLRSRHDWQSDAASHGYLMALADEHHRGCSAKLQGATQEAEVILSKVMREGKVYAARSRGQRSTHFTTLSRLATKTLALVLFDQNRDAEAEKMQRELKLSMESELRHDADTKNPPFSEALLDVTFDLARTLEIRSQWLEAEELQLVVKEGRAGLFGPTHEKTTLARRRLVKIFGGQQKWSEAEHECKEVIIACEQRLGTFHAQTLEAVIDLASMFRGLPGKLGLAEETFARAIEIAERLLGPYNARTLDLASERGLVLMMQRRLQEAEELLQRTKQDMMEHLGPCHDHTQNVISMLDEIVDFE